MNSGRRITSVAIAIFTSLFAWSILTWMSEESGGAVPEPRPSKWDARMLFLDREALDEAYKDRLVHVFAVWMKDDTDQPRRAINGARQARHAYIEVITEIEKREKKP